MKRVIINADDFGMNEICTRAIYKAYQEALITDTTMAANGDDFENALKLINSDERFSHRIGIHFNLTDGEPITDEIKHTRFVENGKFNRYFKTHNASFIVLSRAEKNAIFQELDSQVKKMRDSGIRISHADSHHHIHTGLSISRIIYDVCKRNGIKKLRLRKNVKQLDPARKALYTFYNITTKRNGFTTTDYFGDGIDYVDLQDGVSEAMVHPSFINGFLGDAFSKLPLGEHLKGLLDSKERILISYEEL